MATSQKIKVVCRIRRKVEDEKVSTENGYTFPDDRSVLHTSSGKVYTFDKLFGANASQLEVYNDVAKPIVTGVFNGFNGTILAYGQTSSGKTYTMEGDVTNEEKYGIIPRVAQDIFNRTESLQNSKYEIKISFYEIYLEKIRDLFNDSQKANLKVYDDKKSLPFIVGGKEISVTNVNEIMDLFTKAKLKRHVAATDMNELSSRSHTIFQIVIKQENFTTRKKLIGKLLLVDLAGSEKVSHKDQVDSTVKRESTHINKSLSALTRVISLLSEGSKAVVFYRDSLLTRLLKESLGGNSQTAIIVCVDPSFENETKLSLDFGNRAKVIQNNIHLNEKYCGSKLSRFLGRFLPKNDVYLKEFVSELKRWRNGETVPCDEWIPLHDIEEKLSDSSSLMNNSDNASSVFDQTNNSQVLSDSSLLDLSADIKQESTNTQPVGAKKELEIVIAIEKELAKQELDLVTKKLNTQFEELEQLKMSQSEEYSNCREVKVSHEFLASIYSHLIDRTEKIKSLETIIAEKDHDLECYLIHMKIMQKKEETVKDQLILKNKQLYGELKAKEDCDFSRFQSGEISVTSFGSDETVKKAAELLKIPEQSNYFVENKDSSEGQNSVDFLYKKVVEELKAYFAYNYETLRENSGIEVEQNNDILPQQLSLHEKMLEELLLYFNTRNQTMPKEEVDENFNENLSIQLSLYKKVMEELCNFFSNKHKKQSDDTVMEKQNHSVVGEEGDEEMVDLREKNQTLSENSNKHSILPLSMHDKLLAELNHYFSTKHQTENHKNPVLPLSIHQKLLNELDDNFENKHKTPLAVRKREVYDALLDHHHHLYTNSLFDEEESCESNLTLKATNDESTRFIQKATVEKRATALQKVRPVSAAMSNKRWSTYSEKNWCDDLGIPWCPECGETENIVLVQNPESLASDLHTEDEVIATVEAIQLVKDVFAYLDEIVDNIDSDEDRDITVNDMNSHRVTEAFEDVLLITNPVSFVTMYILIIIFICFHVYCFLD